MYVGSAFVYMVFFLPITLGHNIASVIVGRLIGGIAASTGSTLVRLRPDVIKLKRGESDVMKLCRLAVR